jgi:hypothetical protein
MYASKPHRQDALWAQGLLLYLFIVIYSPLFLEIINIGGGVNRVINRGDFYPGEMTY